MSIITLDATKKAEIDEASYPDLTPRQFWLAALTASITEAAVDTYIDALDEPQRSEAQISKNYAVVYVKTDPLIAQIAVQFDLSDDDVSDLWRLAETL